jgi:uncharacterized protein (DUF1015 family)
MAVIKPFRGVRPPAHLVEKVASRPYDVLNSDEARAEAAGNPMSLYHIIRPEIDFEPDVDEHDEKVYEKAAHNFLTFRNNGWLIQDFSIRFQDAPSLLCLWIYMRIFLYLNFIF